jgi:hypothetical protein
MLALILSWTRHTKTFFKKYTRAKYKNMWQYWHYWHFGIIESAKSVNNVNLRN